MFHNYLQLTTPDIADVLRIRPTGKMLPAEPKKPQQVFYTDGGGEFAASYASKWYFLQEIPWEYLSAADKESIFALYFDPSRANKRQRSFTWEHPIDGQYYVAYFGMDLSWGEAAAGWFSCSGVVLKIIGYTTIAAEGVALLVDADMALLVDADVALLV